jgi:hypothetical protein
VDATSIAITASLALLGAVLAVLSVRAFVRFLGKPEPTQAMWCAGMGMAAVAMAIEALVYAGVDSSGLLEAYVFASAALVGLLSLGCTHVLRSARFARWYRAFILAACAVLAVACALTPLPPGSMVSAGVIWKDPPLTLLVLSSLVTGPATVVLLLASAVSLLRSRHWQNLLIVGGALVLGAGGTLYIASFPVFLYYAEFIGIVLLLGGILSLPRSSPSVSAVPRRAGLA